MRTLRAFGSLCVVLVLAGCELVADFDRSKIARTPADGGLDAAMDASLDGDVPPIDASDDAAEDPDPDTDDDAGDEGEPDDQDDAGE